MKGKHRPGCILSFDNKTLLSRTWTNKFVMLIWLLISQRNWEKPCVCICSLQSTREEDGARGEAAWIQRVKERSLCWKLGAPLAGWYQLAGMCIYCLPSWRQMDSSVCPSVIVFFLTIPYTGYMHGQAPCVYNFIWVVRSCGGGLNHKNYFAAGQDIPLNVSAFCFL